MTSRFLPARRFLALAGALAAALLTASCGGGSSAVDPFKPTRLVVIGDELSAIEDASATHNGLKYTVNGFNSTNTTELDCSVNPIWVQSLAKTYGLVFDACNTAGATVTAINHAAAGATVAGTSSIDLDAQVADQMNNHGGFAEGDLVAVLIGMNDVYALATEVEQATRTQTDAKAELNSRGAKLAATVNTIVQTGAKVILVTVPALNKSPYALATTAPTGRVELLRQLTSEVGSSFNAGLRTNIVQDGSMIGLVVADDIVTAMVSTPTSYGVTNVTQAVCTVALPNCTTQTLATGATVSSHLWADDKRIGPPAQTQIASAAITRAANNPF